MNLHIIIFLILRFTGIINGNQRIQYVTDANNCLSRTLNEFEVSLLLPFEETTLYHKNNETCGRIFPLDYIHCGYPLPGNHRFACKELLNEDEADGKNLYLNPIVSASSEQVLTYSECEYSVQNSTIDILIDFKLFYRGELCGYNSTLSMLQCPPGSNFQDIDFICNLQPISNSTTPKDTFIYDNIGNNEGLDLLLPVQFLNSLGKSTLILVLRCDTEIDERCIPKLSFLKRMTE